MTSLVCCVGDLEVQLYCLVYHLILLTKCVIQPLGHLLSMIMLVVW